MHSSLTNPIAETRVVALPCQNGVAAGTGDNTELTSAAIDTKIAGGVGYRAAVFNMAYRLNLAATQTCALTLKVAESDDGSSFGSDTTLVNAAQIGPTGAVTNSDGVYRLDLNLAPKKRWIRIKVTMNLSAGATDTFVYGAFVELFGADKLPTV
jgi:hypothetical protein